MSVFFSADQHFGHRAIIEYAGRPFSSVEEMDEMLILAWNSRVGPKDEVYHLGDISLSRTDRTREILSRLNGRIYLVRGNHDRVIKGSTADRFEWVKDYYELRRTALEGVPCKPCDGLGQGCLVCGETGWEKKPQSQRMIVLCHYAFRVWNKSHFGSWNLHGHSHSSLPEIPDTRQLDVGVDTRDDYAPYTLDEVATILNKRRYQAVDHHVSPECIARADSITGDD